MKKQFVKLIVFFKKEHLSKYLLEIAFFFAVLTAFLFLAQGDVVSNVLGTIVGFVFSTAILYIIRVIGASLEDALKVNKDTDALLKIYKEGNYEKHLKLNGTSVRFAYGEQVMNDGCEFIVEDDPDHMMELDDFIAENYEKLFSAHTNSVKVNSTTVRLDDLQKDGRKVTFRLGRSTVFNHLITNRAIDFLLFDSLSLRDVYEYGPALRSFKDSKMSNHIGINALVFLSDGAILVPHRGGRSTISKNQITSSIAVKLATPRHGAPVTADYLLRGNILENLTERVHILPEDLREEQIEIRFLGMGQSVYEGGKPQFYYCVTLKDIDTKRYHALSAKNKSESKLDVDKCIYTADYASYRFKKDYVTFDILLPEGGRHRMKLNYEMSYLCNLWHYEEYKKTLQ